MKTTDFNRILRSFEYNTVGPIMSDDAPEFFAGLAEQAIGNNQFENAVRFLIIAIYARDNQ